MAEKFEKFGKLITAKQKRREASAAARNPKPSIEAKRKKRLQDAAKATLRRQQAARAKRRK